MKIILLTLLFFSLSKFNYAQTEEAVSINWLTFEQLSDSLKVKPKKVLIFFHTDWCSYCKKMMKETFADESIIKKLSTDYYSVHFDAESVDTVQFENTVLVNSSLKKKAGQNHQIAQLLLPQKRIAFPITIILDQSFKVTKTKLNYLSIRELLKIL